MDVAEWIIVGILSTTLFIFLIVAIILTIKLIKLSKDAKKIIATSQGIVEKADLMANDMGNIVDGVDNIVDNVKGLTSVGGIVKTFAGRVVENQERKYAEEDAARAAAEEIAKEEIERAYKASKVSKDAKAKKAKKA